jgi:hypothetical protein
MDREKILKVISGEREFQDVHWHGKLPKSPSDELRLIRRHLDIADVGWHATPDDQSTGCRVNVADLDAIRKIAAICFRCMEQHGVVLRDSKTITRDLQ